MAKFVRHMRDRHYTGDGMSPPREILLNLDCVESVQFGNNDYSDPPDSFPSDVDFERYVGMAKMVFKQVGVEI